MPFADAVDFEKSQPPGEGIAILLLIQSSSISHSCDKILLLKSLTPNLQNQYFFKGKLKMYFLVDIWD